MPTRHLQRTKVLSHLDGAYTVPCWFRAQGSVPAHGSRRCWPPSPRSAFPSSLVAASAGTRSRITIARIMSRQRCRPGPCARAIVPPRCKRPCVNHPCGAVNRGRAIGRKRVEFLRPPSPSSGDRYYQGRRHPVSRLEGHANFPMRPSSGVLHLKCKNDFSPFRAPPFQGASTGRYRPGGALSALFERSSGKCDRQAARRRSRARLDRVF